MAEKRKWVIANCPVCAKDFKQRPDGRIKTCSRSCARKLEWQRKIRDGQIKARYKHKSGYWMVRMPGHPRAYKNKWVFEHLIVMEKILGRPVLKGEYVHHKNGDRGDNHPENLELWAGRKDPPGQREIDRVVDYLRSQGWDIKEPNEIFKL